ncbi:hypothetical protein [Actinomadura chokoriensis]
MRRPLAADAERGPAHAAAMGGFEIRRVRSAPPVRWPTTAPPPSPNWTG